MPPGITPAGAGKTEEWKSKYEKEQDHPRRCGENYTLRANALKSKGSPPQVRGKLRSRDARALPFRITPAGAGKTYVDEIVDLDSEDHPRRCGENLVLVSVKKPFLGSPPQVRGKLVQLATGLGKTGITPAGAGKTRFERAGLAGAEDHPRRCGENDAVLRMPFNTSGSPPQVRGKRDFGR